MTFQSILSWGWVILNQGSTVLKWRTLTIKHTQYFNPSKLKRIQHNYNFTCRAPLVSNVTGNGFKNM